MSPLGLSKPAIAMVAALSPMSVTAAEVELKSPDGFISIEGSILSVGDVMITVETSVGEIKVPKSEVACYGAACPSGITRGIAEEQISIAVASPQNAAVLRDVLQLTSPSSSRRVKRQSEPLLLANATDGSAANVSIVDGTADSTITLISHAHGRPAQDTIGTLREWTTASAPPSQLFAAKALAVVVSEDAGVSEITVQQLAAIYAGDITNWAQLGGADMAITPIKSADDSALYQDVLAAVMTPLNKAMGQNIFTMNDAETILNAMAAIPGGVGIVPADAATAHTTLGIADSCGVTTYATDFDVKSGTYPLTISTVAEYSAPLETTLVQAAFDTAAFAQSQSVITAAGFVDASLITLPDFGKNARVSELLTSDHAAFEREKAASLIELMFEADQVSVSFAGGDLDTIKGAWTRAHFIRLAEAIKTGAFDGKELVFVGFADDGATAQDRITAAQTAADDIMAAFQAFAPEAAARPQVSFVASGHGAVSDVGCFHGSDAVSRSTKIEVWARQRL